MLVLVCVLGHAPVYVQDVQVAQGVQELVRGTVGLHALMPALLGVRNQQMLVVEVHVPACVAEVVEAVVPLAAQVAVEVVLLVVVVAVLEAVQAVRVIVT